MDAGEEPASATSKVYVNVVPVPASEAPRYQATPAPHVPVTTAAYVPSGMASSTKGAASSTGAPVPSYTPPLFEGAASRFSVGVSSVIVVLAAGVLLL
ncbi:hypothetical protein PMIN03_003990 [Paraphaeosphaeria minitans]